MAQQQQISPDTRIRFFVERFGAVGAPITTFGEFCDDNDFDAEDVRQIAHEIAATGFAFHGGGAAPLIRIEAA